MIIQEQEALDQLKELVRTFNEFYRMWENHTGHGANFRFVYAQETGRKEMQVTDLAPMTSDRPSPGDPRIEEAARVIDAALEAVEGGDDRFVPAPER